MQVRVGMERTVKVNIFNVLLYRGINKGGQVNRLACGLYVIAE